MVVVLFVLTEMSYIMYIGRITLQLQIKFIIKFQKQNPAQSIKRTKKVVK